MFSLKVFKFLFNIWSEVMNVISLSIVCNILFVWNLQNKSVVDSSMDIRVM